MGSRKTHPLKKRIDKELATLKKGLEMAMGEGLENRVAIGKGGKLVLREDLTRVKEKVSEFFEQINGSHESRIALIKDIYSAFDIIRPKLHYMLNIDSHIKYALERL